MSRILDTFLDLVRISSPSGREKGVADYVAAALQDAGCEVRFDDSADRTGADTGNIIAVLPGNVVAPVIALGAHMDCVSPCENVQPVVSDGWIRSEGDTVLGGDDKAGVAALIEVARRLAESGADHGDVKFLLTVSEEIGLIGAKALSAGDAAADLCLVLDADGDVGGIVTGAPTQYTFEAVFQGRSAHAGVEPEKGASAIRMASAAISAMRLGRLDASTTANIGTISGGSATNVVAPLCTVTGECRSQDADEVERVRGEMDSALRAGAVEFGGTVDVSWKLEYRGFRVADDAPAVQLLARACARAGVEPHTFATGGGSDGNIISALGVTTLVLSIGMTNVHTTEEVLEVAQLDAAANLLEAVVLQAAEQ